MTRERLEALSDGCLHRLADNELVDYDDDTSREELILLIMEALAEKRQERFLQNNHPIRVEETKFFVSQDEELSGMEEFDEEDSGDEGAARGGRPVSDDDELPVSNKLILLLRDPSWAYAYWELSRETRATLEEKIDDLSLYLRCYEIDGDMPTEHNLIDYFDIPLQFHDQSRYINLAHSGSVYKAEIVAVYSPAVVEGEEAEMVSLVRSNPVRPPRNYVALEEGASSHSLDTDALLALSGLGECGASSLELTGSDDERQGSPRIISLEGAELLMKIVEKG